MTTDSCPYEVFPALEPLPVVHAFSARVPGLDVKADRATALARLDSYHSTLREKLGLSSRVLVNAEQVHGNRVGVADASTSSPVPDADALVTADPTVCLGIHVADCGAVFFVDPVRRVIACAHSGRKGTELQIVPATLDAMFKLGSAPENIVAQIGPCIRPPHYQVDFAAEIVRQCHAAGVRQVHDCGICTATHPDRYYSYRREEGKTGRMLALLALKE